MREVGGGQFFFLIIRHSHPESCRLSPAATGRGKLMRILISDFENTAVAAATPADGLSGTVVRRIALQDWGDNWLLLAPDNPLKYHGESYSQVLIRSRLVSYEPGRDEWASVFVLTLPDSAVLDKSAVDSKDFEHITWASATLLPVP
jgi:hypothetical protein